MKKISHFFKSTTQVVGVASLAFLTTQCGEDTTKTEQTQEVEKARSKVSRAEEIRQSQGTELAQTESLSPLAPAEWAGKNPEDIAEQLKENGSWDSEKGAFYKSWGVFAPKEAIAHIEAGDPKSLTGLKAAVIQGWASSDVRGAKEWIGKQPKNVERSNYITQSIFATRTNKDDVERNSELESWLVEEKDTPGIKQSIRAYTTPLLENDLDGTLKWVSSSLDKGSLREGVARGIMKYSASQSRSELRDNVTNWMSNAEPGDFRDEMIYAYVQENSSVDPEATLQWAKVIKDKDLKESAVKLCESMQ